MVEYIHLKVTYITQGACCIMIEHIHLNITYLTEGIVV